MQTHAHVVVLYICKMHRTVYLGDMFEVTILLQLKRTYFMCLDGVVDRAFTQGRPQDLAGEGTRNIFFSFGNCLSHALCNGGSGACSPRNYFKMVRFGVYFGSDFVIKKI